jgi:hypothetical protein
MDSMMDAIKSCNHIKIQQLFENEHVIFQRHPSRASPKIEKNMILAVPLFV